jgi:hypothetical protein
MDDLAAIATRFRRWCDDDDILLVGGSTVVGFGQESSDLDLYLVRANSDMWSAIPERADANVELEIFGDAALGDEGDRLRRMLSSDDATVAALPQERLVRVATLLTAVPVVDRSNRWPSLRRALGDTAYTSVVARWHRTWAARAAGLGAVLARAGDLEAADAAIRATVAHTLDAIAVEAGELYFSPKYRFQKLARAGLHDHGADAWRFHASGALRPGAVRRRLADVVTWAAERGVNAAVDPVMVPRRRGDAVLVTVGEDDLVIRGRRCWRATSPVGAVWPHIDDERRWEALVQRSGVDERAVAAAVRFLSHRDLLMVPDKLGRWATWV